MSLYLYHSASLLLPNPILPNSYKLDLPQSTCRCQGEASSGLKSGPCAQITLALTVHQHETNGNIWEKSEQFH